MSSTETEIVRPSLDDVYGSLTWFDEQAIQKHFSLDIHELMEVFVEGAAGLSQVVTIVRAFEFIAATREGAKEHVAIGDVRKLTAKELNDLATAYLANEDEEVDPEQPVTEAGKAGSVSE